MSRRNAFFSQPVKVRGMWLLQAFLRVSGNYMEVDTLPELQAFTQEDFCILQSLYNLDKCWVIRGCLLKKKRTQRRGTAQNRNALEGVFSDIFLCKVTGHLLHWVCSQKYSVLVIIQTTFK